MSRQPRALLRLLIAICAAYALWTPAIFWLGRHFPFTRDDWKRAAAVHVPASILITSAHLVLVAIWRYFLQGLRGGDGGAFSGEETTVFGLESGETIRRRWTWVGTRSSNLHLSNAPASAP
jgi:hypothetical protein